MTPRNALFVAGALCGSAALAAPSILEPASAAPPATEVPAAFTQCATCHSIKRAKNGVGPTLYKVMGRKAATQPGFKYSAALKVSKLVWNRATVARYLADPAATVPGTTMPDPRLATAERDAIVAYLSQIK